MKYTLFCVRGRSLRPDRHFLQLGRWLPFSTDYVILQHGELSDQAAGQIVDQIVDQIQLRLLVPALLRVVNLFIVSHIACVVSCVPQPFVHYSQHIVRVDDRIMKYCVIDYYDGKLWYTGSCARCKTWVLNHIDGYVDNNGKMVYMGRWER